LDLSNIKENNSQRLIDSRTVLGALLTDMGVCTLTELVDYVHNLPYGRNSSRSDFSLVISEGKGTCSSKHALIKSVALENAWDDVELILAMVEMNGENTPKINRMLQNRNIAYFPEAHCYLKVGGQRLDLTFPNNKVFKFEDTVLVERIIQPESVVNFKIDFHISYMKQWCGMHNYSYDKMWLLREKCINRLSQ
jgi:hypothetical protein